MNPCLFAPLPPLISPRWAETGAPFLNTISYGQSKNRLRLRRVRIRYTEMGGQMPLVRQLEHDEGIYRRSVLAFARRRRGAAGRIAPRHAASCATFANCRRRRTATRHARRRTQPGARRGYRARQPDPPGWRTGHREKHALAPNGARHGGAPHPLCERGGERTPNQTARRPPLARKCRRRRHAPALRNAHGAHLRGGARRPPRIAHHRFGANHAHRDGRKLARQRNPDTRVRRRPT